MHATASKEHHTPHDHYTPWRNEDTKLIGSGVLLAAGTILLFLMLTGITQLITHATWWDGWGWRHIRRAARSAAGRPRA